MNACPVCGTPNHHLNVVCASCGGYVQGRVDNLDLFSTIWRLIESPGRMFLSISLARYKNYSTIVPAIAGIGIVFMLFWFIKAGDYTSSPLNLLVGGMAVGPVVGVFLLLLMSWGLYGALKISGVAVRFRNLYAVLAYSLVPVMLSVVFLLPLVFFTFGKYFFSLNPPPWLIRPVSYYIFLGLGSIVLAWTAFLIFTGIRILLDCTWKIAAVILSVITGGAIGISALLKYFLTAGGG